MNAQRVAAASAIHRWSLARFSAPKTLLLPGEGGSPCIRTAGRRAFASLQKPPRDTRYSTIEDRDLKHFQGILSEQSSIVTDPHALAPLNEDWLRKYHGHSK